MAVNPTTDEKFSIFSDGDRQFLARFFVEHPKVGEKFNKFLGCPQHLRPDYAKVTLFDVKRAGWVKRGISNPESVFDHSIGLSQLIRDYMRKVQNLIPRNLSETTKSMAIRMEHMAKIHDMSEAIVTDFTPQDKISEEDKHRVELLAAKVIFEAPQFAKGLALVTEYIEQESPVSHLVHDFDKIHAVIGALYFESKYPDKIGLFKEFYDYALPRMKTDAGKNYLMGLEANKDCIMAGYRELHAKPAKGAVRGG